MGLLETLMLGSYMYSTAIFVWFQRKYEKIRNNHLVHIENAINEARAKVDLPPVTITGED